MEHMDGRHGLARRRGLRRVALGGAAALALAGFAGMAQVTGSAFADEITAVPALKRVNLKLTNAPTTDRKGAAINVKSVKVVTGDGTGPFDLDLGCFAMTPGQTVDTLQKVFVGDSLTATLFAAENCDQTIPGGVIPTPVSSDATGTEFVFDLDGIFRNG